MNAGTADLIGVYTSVAASRFSGSVGCAPELVPKVDATPKAMVAWMGLRDLHNVCGISTIRPYLGRS